MKRSFELWYIFKREVGDHAIFDDDHNDIQIYFNVQEMLNLKVYILMTPVLNYILITSSCWCQIDNQPALVAVKASRKTVNKPLPEPMMTHKCVARSLPGATLYLKTVLGYFPVRIMNGFINGFLLHRKKYVHINTTWMGCFEKNKDISDME